jgi:peptidoglycan/LPS O-acetylase OafA/YrhL
MRAQGSPHRSCPLRRVFTRGGTLNLMASTPDTTRPRLHALDGLRGLACLGIAALHVWMFDYGDSHHPPKSVLDYAMGELRLAVPLFFVLSGFLVYRPFVAAALEGRPRPRLGRYALKRAARILPGYWAAVIGVFVLLRAIDHPFAIAPADLPRFLLFAQNQSEVTLDRLDPPMWTLAVEATFYLLVPVTGLIALRVGRGRARQVVLTGALLALGAGLVAAAHFGRWPATTTTSLVANLSTFAAGMTAAALIHGRELARRTGWLLIAAGGGLVVGDAVWHALAIGPLAWRAAIADQPAAIGFALVIAGLAASPARIRALDVPPLTTAGTLSFGLYLWHFPAIYGLRAAGWWSPHLLVALTSTLAVAGVAALISWKVLEQPAIAWAHRARRDRGTPTRRTAAAGRDRSPTAAEPALAAGPSRT